MTTDAAQALFDANVRVESMFWIAGICASPPQEFEDFLEGDLQDCKDIIDEFPWLSVEGMTGEDALSEFAFKNIDGFFVQLATPSPRDIKSDNSFWFSWGSYRIKWFFFRTLDEIPIKAKAWADEVLQAARQKAA